MHWNIGEMILPYIITAALRNGKLELKTKFQDSKFGERLNVKEKLKQNKRNNQCNFNSQKKGIS